MLRVHSAIHQSSIRSAMNIFSIVLLLCSMSLYVLGCQTTPGEAVGSAPGGAIPHPLLDDTGNMIQTVEEWESTQRSLLLDQFAREMYGIMPAAEAIEATLLSENPDFMDGEATLKQVRIAFGPEGTQPIELLLAIPNIRTEPAPVILGLNFYGNHAVSDAAEIPLTSQWVPERGEGVEDNKATDASRGTASSRWSIKQNIDKGYAVATFYHADVDPDRPDFTDGIHSTIPVNGSTERTETSWGTLAAWAWGLHRAVDYLITDADIDSDKIAVMGHSRNGKAALLAGATDARIDLVISNQSGCGGAALSRRKMGETVEAINTNFPHWFSQSFRKYNDNEAELPFDQHQLIALIAPRPVLVASAEEDLWADPEGELMALVGANPVYQIYGFEGLEATGLPQVNTLIGKQQGYHIRPGGHGVGPADWAVFTDFAEMHFGNTK